jgi:hypothetical protein
VVKALFKVRVKVKRLIIKLKKNCTWCCYSHMALLLFSCVILMFFSCWCFSCVGVVIFFTWSYYFSCVVMMFFSHWWHCSSRLVLLFFLYGATIQVPFSLSLCCCYFCISVIFLPLVLVWCFLPFYPMEVEAQNIRLINCRLHLRKHHFIFLSFFWSNVSFLFLIFLMFCLFCKIFIYFHFARYTHQTLLQNSITNCFVIF